MEEGTDTRQVTTAVPQQAYPGGRWRIWRSPTNDQTRASRESSRELRLVQSELRLETVKVVRNDLTDSDLLLVPLRPSVERTIRSHKPECRKAVPSRWWSRLLGILAGF